MREQRHAGTVVVKRDIQGQQGHERTERHAGTVVKRDIQRQQVQERTERHA